LFVYTIAGRASYRSQVMARSSTTLGSAGDANGSAAILLRRVSPPGPGTSGQRVVSLVELLDETCAGCLSTVDYSGSLIRLPSDDWAVPLDEATMIGLIVGEAVSNAIKYSHPTGVAGKITVQCRQHGEGGIAIGVTDDGVGLPENFDPELDGNVGFRMMRALSDRLEAALAFESSSLGLGVSLRVPNKPNELALLAPSCARDDGDMHSFSNASARKDFTQDRRAGNAADGRLELLEALPVAVYMTDAEGRITFYNEAAAKLWGYRPELGKDEFCGSWKLYWPEGTPLPHDECPMAIALRQKEAVRGVEAVAQRPDGTRVPFIPYPTPLFDGSGTMVGAVNMLLDISERKRAEVTLARHRDEQAALYQLTDGLFRAASLSGVCDAALDAIQRALGCERASILLLNDADQMKFVAWRGLSEEYRRAVEGHSPWTRDVKEPQPICVSDVETADIAEDLKATVKAEGLAALAFIPIVVNGELVGKFMTYYDAPHIFSDAEIGLAVTIARQLGFSIERIRAEEGRQRGEQASRLLASIIETSDDAIVSKDTNGIVTSWNDGAERVFGYTADEMIGKPIMTLVPPDRHNEEPDFLERIRRGERIDHYETVRQRKDGSLIDISLTVSPLKDAAGKVVGASKIARDITESKQAQARNELLTREIQHRTKNLFAVVQAVVARSFSGKQTAKEAETAVVDRLRSLAQTHVMLMDKEWQGANLAEVVRAEMSPYADRVQVEGPDLVLTAKAAQNFALALHELATNAAKYGALSNATGRVRISWSTSKPTGIPVFAFRWQEVGGPPVLPPAHKGFGSVVLEQVMDQYFDVPPRVDFAVGGVSYELNGSLEALSEQLTSNA
jgi:PAS domain S-box-containing protein